MSLLKVALVAALIALPAAAEPPAELLREEAFNYRVVGELPRGWKRRGDALVFDFAAEEIPHAHVHLLRGRLEGVVDVEAELKARAAAHYRFPGAGAGSETVRREPWAGRDAFLLEHEATVNGVPCRRRVAAFVAAGIWYERIETIYGDKTEAMGACRDGLDVFRKGFRLLVEPLTAAEKADAAERAIESAEFGFRIVKPQGFLRKDVDLAVDPGLRVAFEAREADPRKGVLVRLLEYGVRKDIPPEAWMGIFFDGFREAVPKAARAAAAAPEVPGAAEILAERFTGEREGRAIEELVVCVRSEKGRILCLRIRTTDGTPAPPVTLQVNG
jgi:hypothetical protein